MARSSRLVAEVHGGASLSGAPGAANPSRPQPPARAILEPPGDAAQLVLRHGRVESPFGPALVACSPRGVVFLGFPPVDRDPHATLEAALGRRFVGARLREDPPTAAALARAIFGPGPRPPVHLRGSAFERAVWAALLRLGPGETTSYGAIARAIGRPGAARAVGGAVGRNPVSVLVPCHRVLGAGGRLGGFHWGEAIKRALLEAEGAISIPPPQGKIPSSR